MIHMEQISLHNEQSIKDQIIKAFKEKDPEAEKKFREWFDQKEKETAKDATGLAAIALYIELGELYLQSGLKREAKEILESAITQAKEKQDKELEDQAEKLLQSIL